MSEQRKHDDIVESCKQAIAALLKYEDIPANPSVISVHPCLLCGGTRKVSEAVASVEPFLAGDTCPTCNGIGITARFDNDE